MSPLSDKLIVSTKEAHTICGTEAIFEEIEALYASTLLKPFRIMPNNSRSWSVNIVIAALNHAQQSGALYDRPKVEAAVEKLRASKRLKGTTLKGRDMNRPCAV